ncbi:MAG: fecR family protein [Rhodospirillales bacterium]|nr:fecR family protein [Rhodospirillales bacterium]
MTASSDPASPNVSSALMDDSRDPLATSLADCLACLQAPEADPAARAHWRAWLDASPERQRRYDELLRFWTALPAAEERRRGRFLLGRTSLGRTSLGATTRATHRPWMALAACLLLLAVAGWWREEIWAPSPVELHYAAAQGEQKRVTLPDGSSVLLDADSQLVAKFERRERVVQLMRGQALFDVAHDAARPFIVRARGGEIRAVGTEFDVQLTDSGVDVTLLQGAVLVAPPYASSKDEPPRREPRQIARLAPGQQVSYRDELSAIRTVDPSIAVTWREGRPSYLNRPLGAVIADLRRYVALPVRFADASVADIRYTGTISVNDLGSWTRALESAFPIRATVDGDGAIVLAHRRDGF